MGDGAQRLEQGGGLTTVSAAPGKEFSLSRQGQHVGCPTGHLHHLIAQQGLHNGGLEREGKQERLGKGAGLASWLQHPMEG